MKFIVPDHDEILPFDQHFAELPEKRHRPAPRRPPPPSDPGPLPL
jgi:hypothetical protein